MEGRRVRGSTRVEEERGRSGIGVVAYRRAVAAVHLVVLFFPIHITLVTVSSQVY